MTRKSILFASVLFMVLSSNTLFAMMGGMGGSSSGSMNSQSHEQYMNNPQHDQYMNGQESMNKAPRGGGSREMNHNTHIQIGVDHKNMDHGNMDGYGSQKEADAFFEE